MAFHKENDARMRSVTNLPLSSPSRPAHLRQVNARTLLRLIQLHGPCSKADLVRHSGLSAPTITSCVALLEKLELVEAIGDGRSSGGRPPGLLQFHVERGYVAAADIGGTRLRMMLADLGGTVKMHWSHVLRRKQKTPAGMCALIHQGLKEMRDKSGIEMRRVLHLTAGAPGITDVAAGVVLSAPNLSGWENVPLRSMLVEQMGIPVVVENDTNLAAAGEHRYGAARESANFVFLAIGTGAGAGIFIDGHLHRGASWSAGEIGYLGLSAKARKPMRLRETGQLEEMIGGGGIEAQWQKMLCRGKARPSPEMLRLRATQILDLAVRGNHIAGRVAAKTASLLADAIGDVVLLLDPQLVVLGGGVGSHPALCGLTQAAIVRHELASGLTIRSSSLGTQAQLCGGIATSIEAVHELLLVSMA